jgi:hypothetical protein
MEKQHVSEVQAIGAPLDGSAKLLIPLGDIF